MFYVTTTMDSEPINGIGLKDESGSLLIITTIELRIERKWFRKKSKAMYEVIELPTKHYENLEIMGDLSTYEKVCLYQMLSDELKRKFTRAFKHYLLQSDMFWGKAKSFIQETALSFLELNVICELFQDKIAKENIVGIEVSNGIQRYSFNLTDNTGTRNFVEMVRRTVQQGEMNAVKNRNQTITHISQFLTQVF